MASWYFDIYVCMCYAWVEKKKLMMAPDQQQFIEVAKKLSFQIYAASICQLVQCIKGMNDFFEL